MPKATTSTKPQRFELSSCPGGFVELKRMTHGQRLHRQDISMNIMATQDQRSRTAEMNIAPTQTRVAQYEFQVCIVSHNLEKDDEGTLFNFDSPADFAALDPRIGEEISSYIETLHDWQASLPNSESRSIVPSTVVIDHSTDQSTRTTPESQHKQ
jgi:hypothetical protein